jgi:alpha-beta hydrolase superfamily lysophospholipase
MPGKCLGWRWQYRKGALGLVLMGILVGLNLIAYNHAFSMTHFRESGSRTGSPETLSFVQKVKVLFLGIRIPRPVNRIDPHSQGLSFQTWHFQAKDGLRLEAWHIPQPEAKGLVLLLHGYSACKASLLPEVKVFHDLGYATVLLDFRGSGGSDGNVTTLGVYEAEDVAAVVESLQKSHPDRSPILYGQSMGSVAILRAISEHGIQPKAVIIECPFDRLLSTVENRFSAMGVPAFPGAVLLVFWGGVQHGFNGFRHNPVDYARAVRCPVLLMHGEKDPRVTKEQTQAIFESLSGEKHFQLFPDVGHQSCLRGRPDLWIRTVSEFLSEQRVSVSPRFLVRTRKNRGKDSPPPASIQ